jgi:serine phosphatase RsbU (regulator of sigma subunit)
VGGDWYQLAGLGGGRFGIAVGDVVGHGPAAARVMGLLRGALAAALRAAGAPARALKALDAYADGLPGATAATAVQVVVDRGRLALTYSCAGHLPPLLVRADGAVRFLDGATDPPLGVWGPDTDRSQAGCAFAAGDTLVLYTDGLVERRGEDIDAGLARLVQGLVRHHALDPEPLAGALLAELAGERGFSDDVTLVLVRL